MVQGQAGNVRATLLVNRADNRAMVITEWESEQAALATGEGSEYLREAIGKLRGLVVPKTVEQWEVAL